MWQLDNRTPFAAERTWVRDRNGAEVWLVAVKCTFDIERDGSPKVAAEQPPVTQSPEYFGDPAKSSLKYDSDLIMTKKTTDIILNGHAYAPNGKPAHKLDIGFRVGPVAKVLRVFGDRVWETGLSTSFSEPKPFVKMPLIYERAYGGTDTKAQESKKPAWDWRNPLGTGYALSAANLNGVPVPNIEYVDQLIKHWNDRPPPSGFGPICSHWQPRVQYAGTYDDKWLEKRMPLLPEDFDERFLQCAPADQQAPRFLNGDEPVVLKNMTPSGDLHFYLPKVSLGFRTYFYDGEHEVHHPSKLHTVILEPDFPRVSLVWHTAFPCHPKVLKLKHTTITQQGEPWTIEEKENLAEQEV